MKNAVNRLQDAIKNKHANTRVLVRVGDVRALLAAYSEAHSALLDFGEKIAGEMKNLVLRIRRIS